MEVPNVPGVTPPLYPDGPPLRSAISLLDVDSNAFSIIGTVMRGLKVAARKAAEDGEWEASRTAALVAEFQREAMSGGYDHLLATAMKWTEGDGVPEELEED